MGIYRSRKYGGKKKERILLFASEKVALAWAKRLFGENLSRITWRIQHPEACFSCLFRYTMPFDYAFVNFLSREFAVKRQDNFAYHRNIPGLFFY